MSTQPPGHSPAENAADAPPPNPPSYDYLNVPRDYYAPRVRDFEPGSCGTSIREPDAESLLPTYAAAARPWGRYKSEAAYLDALRAFVKQKEYVDGPVDDKGVPVGIIGFYGTKTAAHYAALPPLRDGRRKSKAKKPSASDAANSDANINPDDPSKPKGGLRHWLRKRGASSSAGT